MGFFIAYLGFKNTGLATFSDSGLALGDFYPACGALLALITLAVMGVLTAYKVRGADSDRHHCRHHHQHSYGCVYAACFALVSLPDMSEIRQSGAVLRLQVRVG